MITDPTEGMARRIAKSDTARICHSCLAPIMVRRATGHMVILDAHPVEDGNWSIRADEHLTAYRTDYAVNRYRQHRCQGDE